MKTIQLSLLSLFISTGVFASPVFQDSLGLAGDNLDLYGVLELFKKSENPEEFEKALNKEDNKLNNLDLNGDGQIDYIHVIDRADKDAHALVLQVAVSETESQDVAVIEIEKKGDAAADVQIVGDPELYGKDYIVEPAEEPSTKTPENKTSNNSNTTVIVNVWHWPSVQYMYRPSYVVWISPWGWRHYPGWWRPWRPMHWHHYHPHWAHYHGFHRRVYTHRVVTAHNVYYGHRRVAKTIVHRSPAPAHKATARPVRKVQKMNRQQQPRKQQAAPKQGRQGKQGGQKHSGKRK
jgi:hypothetical protein